MTSLAIALALSQTPTFSDNFILSMSREKWTAYHGEKVGQSTADMCDAQVLFGEALKRRNDKRTPPSKVQIVKSLRKPMAEFRWRMIDVGSAFTGGGTMWNPVYAATLADVEEVIAKVIGANPKAKKPYVVSVVTKQFDKMEKSLIANREEIDISKPSSGGFAMAMDSLEKGRTNYAALVQILGNQPRGVSDLVIEFCSRNASIYEEFLAE